MPSHGVGDNPFSVLAPPWYHPFLSSLTPNMTLQQEAVHSFFFFLEGFSFSFGLLLIQSCSTGHEHETLKTRIWASRCYSQYSPCPTDTGIPGWRRNSRGSPPASSELPRRSVCKRLGTEKQHVTHDSSCAARSAPLEGSTVWPDSAQHCPFIDLTEQKCPVMDFLDVFPHPSLCFPLQKRMTLLTAPEEPWMGWGGGRGGGRSRGSGGGGGRVWEEALQEWC